MPLQDLTPQLRTRLNRMERSVGWFVMLATLLLLVGFGYYLYNNAKSKGWFAIKARYYTYGKTAIGLAVGDKVTLMGFIVGEITDIQAMPPRGWEAEHGHNVFIEFRVLNDNYGYLWVGDSHVRFTDSGFLGKRQLDLTKGTNGYGTYILYNVRQMSLADIQASSDKDKLRLGEEIYITTNAPAQGAADGTNIVTNLALKAWSQFNTTNLELLASLKPTNLWVIDRSRTNTSLTGMWNEDGHHYQPVTKDSKYYLPPDEPPALNDRVQAMVAQLEAAVPQVLKLTNQLATVLSNAVQLTSNFNQIAISVRPSVTNLNAITENLRNPEGSLGEWIIPTNINQKLDATLVSANGTLSNVDTNLATLNLTLGNLANITSNLNNQVQANTNILTNISDAIVHTDQFIQGLKRFWLFRHLFAAHPAKTSPTSRKSGPLLSPKQKGQ
jgi:hypothetical protein